MNKKCLGLKIGGIVCSVVAFLAMLFPFVISNYTLYTQHDSKSYSETMSFKNWLEVLKIDSDKMWAWQLSRVLMIVVLILVALVSVTSIVNIFIKKKISKNIFKYVSVAGIVLSSLFVVFFFIGCLLQFSSGQYASGVVFPHVGSILLGVSSLVASILNLKSLKHE